MVFHGRLSDSKSHQVSRTLLSILAVFNNAVVWMVSTRPPTSKFSRPFNNPLVIEPKAPITIGIIVTYMFHIIIIIIIINIHLSIFTPALADGFSMAFEWQQVSSSLQDSSQYSGWCQQGCNLDGLRSTYYFQVLQCVYQFIGDSTACTDYNWYHRHFHVLEVFSVHL